MHSRIFGIVEKSFYEENINNYNWDLSVLEYEVPSFADYCNTNTEIDKDFIWLIENFVNAKHIDTSLFDIDDKELTIKFKPGFKEAYFRSKWENLIKNVIGSPDAFEQFCGINDRTDFAYRCRKLINEEYGFYVADEYGNYETLDDFIRRINYDEVYKCFASCDYHF